VTGRLKVYDSDTATWKYVDASGANVELLRYVPLTPISQFAIINNLTADVAQTHCAPITALPANAVAVSVELLARHSVIDPSWRCNIYDYEAVPTAQPLRLQAFAGKVANHFEASYAAYVVLGGDRQFDYNLDIVAAGTSLVYAVVTGYWLKDISTGVGTGGGTGVITAPVRTAKPTTSITASTSAVSMGAQFQQNVVAPASGRVLLLANIVANNPNAAAIADMVIQYRVDGGAWIDCGGHAYDGASSPRMQIHCMDIITGLNPNQTYSIQLGWYVSSGATGTLDAAGRGAAASGSKLMLLPLA